MVGPREDTLDLPAGDGSLGSDFPSITPPVFRRLRDTGVKYRAGSEPTVFLRPPRRSPKRRRSRAVAPSQRRLPATPIKSANPSGNFFILSPADAIDGTALARQLLRGEDGASSFNFEGVARNNTKGRATRFLEYECYEPMALRMLAEIGADIARTNHQIGRIAMVHRLGRLEISETSVAVVVTSPAPPPRLSTPLSKASTASRKWSRCGRRILHVDGEVWVDWRMGRRRDQGTSMRTGEPYC